MEAKNLNQEMQINLTKGTFTSMIVNLECAIEITWRICENTDY